MVCHVCEAPWPHVRDALPPAVAAVRPRAGSRAEQRLTGTGVHRDVVCSLPAFRPLQSLHEAVLPTGPACDTPAGFLFHKEPVPQTGGDMHSHVPHSARTGAPQRPAARSHTSHTCLAPRLAPRLPLLPGLGAVAGSLKVLFGGTKSVPPL